MQYNNLTKDNIKLYAASIYNNPTCSSLLEFEDDYKRIKYIKSLVNKYLNNKPVNLRILINHMICLANVFPKGGTAVILFAELEESTWGILATFLIFLSLLPERINNIRGQDIISESISYDENLLNMLQGM